MATNWTLYENLLSVGDGVSGERNHAINDALNSFLDGVINDPAYISDAKIGGVTAPIVASRNSTIKCSIKATPDTSIHIGDVVECFGESWIVVELYVDRIGVINGEMWLCNHVMKFQNRSSEIFSRHCVIDDGTYSKMSDSDAFVLTNTYKLYVSKDDATEKLYVDKRISLGEIYSSEGLKILEVYKTIGIDTKSKNHGQGSHLLVLTLQRDVYDRDADSMDDGICDVYEQTSSTDISTDANMCSIKGKDNIRIGTSRSYEIIANDGNVEFSSDIEVVWQIASTHRIEYHTSERTCVIDVPLEVDIVGDTIEIMALSKSDSRVLAYKKVKVIAIG